MKTASAASLDIVSTKFGWKDGLFLLLSPLVAYGVLHMSFFGQWGYVDPWLYTGVGQVFEKLVEVHGWAYYYVRFPITFVNRLFCLNSHPDVGFILLRYCLILGAGGALYAMALKQFGRVAAVTGYLFLFLNPLFLRVITWDLTPFLSVPAVIAGAALWLFAEKDLFLRYAAAGALFCVSVNSHLFTSTAIGCFLLGVVGAHVTLRRPLWHLAVRLLSAALGFVAMWVAGWWYYRSLVGPIDPLLFWRVSTNALASGSNYAITHARPFATWAAIETYFYVPFILLAACFALPRPADERNPTYARRAILLASLGYGGFYLFYRFVLGRFVIEEFYYFQHIWAIFPLLIPVVIAQAEFGAVRGRTLAMTLISVMIAFDCLIMLQNQGKIAWLYEIHGSLPVLIVVLLAAIAGLAVMRRCSGRRLGVLVGFLLFAAAMQLVSVLPESSWTVYAPADGKRQRQVYCAATQYSHVWEKYAGKTNRPFLWFPSVPGDHDLSSIGYMTMGDTLQDRDLPGGMPDLGATELERLGLGYRNYLILMAKDRESIVRGKAALTDAGLQFSSREETTLTSGDLTIYVEVIQYMKFRTL